MPGSEKKNQPPPSYEDGELRDKRIKCKQRVDFQSEDLQRLIEKAVKKAPRGASS